MSDEKKIEFSQSDVLNALLHQRGHEQHYATQESVDNVKEGVKELASQVSKQFEQVDKRFERLETRIDQVDNKVDSLKNLIIGMGFSILVGAVGATAFIVSRLPA